MMVSNPSHPSGLRPAARAVCVAAFSALAWLSAGHSALAVPLSFTDVNTATQSRIVISATAQLSGTTLIEGPQFAPGGLNGNGSESTLYNQTSTNTPSNMLTNLGSSAITFPGGGTSQAANTVGLLGNSLAVTPGVGGATGSAAADYGVVFTSPQSVVIPPIDISSLGISGITSLNLGTLTGINLNVALRNFAIDLHSSTLPLTPSNGTYPANFDSTQVNFTVTGTSDMSLTATLKQDNIADFLATGAALIALQSVLSGQGIAITESANILGLSYQVGFGFSTALPATSAADADASQGTIAHVGSNLQLTLPVKFDITPATLPSPIDTLLTADFTMTGTLVGQTPFVVVPEPSSMALAAMGLASVALCVRRRRRG